MKTYKVTILETARQSILIQANFVDDAVMAVREGEGEYIGSAQYVETLDPETWFVREIK